MLVPGALIDHLCLKNTTCHNHSICLELPQENQLIFGVMIRLFYETIITLIFSANVGLRHAFPTIHATTTCVCVFVFSNWCSSHSLRQSPRSRWDMHHSLQCKVLSYSVFSASIIVQCIEPTEVRTYLSGPYIWSNIAPVGVYNVPKAILVILLGWKPTCWRRHPSRDKIQGKHRRRKVGQKRTRKIWKKSPVLTPKMSTRIFRRFLVL